MSESEIKAGQTEILADYRQWAAAQPTRVSTHSDRCHLWHEQCMIYRLASALERASQHCDAAALTDAERAAVERAADLIDNKTCGDSSTLRGLLERTVET
jgi:hypothetical protein